MTTTEWMIDCEFSEDGAARPIELISIALVSADGREYYAVSEEFRGELCNTWVKASVLPKLEPRISPVWKSRSQIRDEIHGIVTQSHERPEFWGYYADYDWVLFCQLFGKMVDLPPGWPMLCLDLKQLMIEYRVGDRDMPFDPPGLIEHHALHDARKQMSWLAHMNRFHRTKIHV